MSNIRASWPSAVAMVFLGLLWAVVATLSREEAALKSQRLALLPMKLGRWTAESIAIPESEQKVLRASEVLLRNYYLADLSDGSSASHAAVNAPWPAVLFVAYYQSQRSGATHHSPKHCLPGSGWEFTEVRRTELPGPRKQRVEINEVVIRNGLQRQVLFYWYQERGRILASEYSVKFHLVWDALTQDRTDGALVRVSVPVRKNVAAARAHALRFIGDMWRPLSVAVDSRELLGAPPVGSQ